MRACCFTGHRKYKLGLSNDKLEALKWQLYGRIGELADSGITTFYTGMAEGVDLWAAQAVIQLRKEGRPVKLIAAIPFIGQEKSWSMEDKVLYERIKESCDDKVVLSKGYTSKVYFTRNEYMVDRSDCVLAVYNGSSGGTRYTIEYARKQGKKIIGINPNDFK